LIQLKFKPQKAQKKDLETTKVKIKNYKLRINRGFFSSLSLFTIISFVPFVV